MESKRGYPLPLGASIKDDEGMNFALFSKHATGVKLLVYDPEKSNPIFEILLNPTENKTGEIWHVLIAGLPEKVEYGFLIDGPKISEEKKMAFNPTHSVSDPHARMMNFPQKWNDKRAKELRGRIPTSAPFDWEKDAPLRIPMKDLIIYEMHVRGFTQHSSSEAPHPGTFLGVIEKIPYLKELGVNAVELLPIFEFNECEYAEKHPKTKYKLVNYWGYSTINFFSPMRRYASSPEWQAPINEFKTMVKELHKNGIEVILDVVYNHTAEGGKNGPVYSFRGIDNPVYYMVDSDGNYRDYTGCGNTVNCNETAVSEFILESLRYWVHEMHVDGFRFDLASILTRGTIGDVLADPPVVRAIANDPGLADVKLIAEAWDAAGLYQVGSFPHYDRWSEWNGKYRDDVRDFIKGTSGATVNFVQAICGSQNLYGHRGNSYFSVNFITAHDGFTLQDVVSYQHKHNLDNGENNRDGANDNRTWNCGHEGETQNPKVLKLRLQQKRNFHLALMLSLGTPMILMGDEYGHTRHGNNNTWCQDNELNWFLWNQWKEEKDFFRFYTCVINFRKKILPLFPEKFFTDNDIDWHGHEPFKPDWSEESRFVAYTLKNKINGENLYIAFNAFYHGATIELPPATNNKEWYRIIDTSLPSPEEFLENPKSEPPLKTNYKLHPHTAFVAQLL